MSARSAPADAFGRAARDYERGRPEWPEEAVAELVRALELSRDAAVLDLAAGTGKLTRLLARRFTAVYAVEPDAEMRTVLEEAVPGVVARHGAAEAIPLDEESVDAVFVAEAFHWFDGDRALSEIARVLRPGGGLALLWNEQVGPTEPRWPPEADRLINRAVEKGGAPGGPRYTSGAWREPFARSRFGELHERHTEHELEGDRETLISNVLSVSSIASLPDDERRDLAERLSELIPAQTFRRPMRLDLYWTRLAG